MFDRAAITLGIGPHSSCIVILRLIIMRDVTSVCTSFFALLLRFEKKLFCWFFSTVIS